MPTQLGYFSAGTSVHRGPTSIQITIPIRISLPDIVLSGFAMLGMAGFLTVVALGPGRWFSGESPGLAFRAMLILIAALLALSFLYRQRQWRRAVEVTIEGGFIASAQPSLRGYAYRRFALGDFREAAVGRDDNDLEILLLRRDGKSTDTLVRGPDFRRDDLVAATEAINEAIAATPP